MQNKNIKNAIHSYVKTKQLLENVEADDLSFPKDFIKKQTKVQYLYSMGAMRPTGQNDTWYESQIIFTKHYKDIPVKYKILKNTDGSDRGYSIIQVGFDDDEITINKRVPIASEVRKAIDEYYEKFWYMMSQTKTNESDIENLFIEKGINIKRIYDEDGLYETAIRWIINPRFNILEKRRIMKNLMNKGLPINQAIKFFKDLI